MVPRSITSVFLDNILSLLSSDENIQWPVTSLEHETNVDGHHVASVEGAGIEPARGPVHIWGESDWAWAPEEPETIKATAKKMTRFAGISFIPSDGSRTTPRVPIGFRKYAEAPTIPAPGREYVGLVAILPNICEYPDLQHQLFAIPGWAAKIPQPWPKSSYGANSNS